MASRAPAYKHLRLAKSKCRIDTGTSTSAAAQGADSASVGLPSHDGQANGTEAAAPRLTLEEGPGTFPNGYDPQQYVNVQVDRDLKELFEYVGRYRPGKRQLPCELKPFIPDYIAAMGDVDEFLKPPRPDGKFEPLGLKMLDEPSVHQSDPAIMRKFLRAHMKGTGAVNDDNDNDGEDVIHHGDQEHDAKIQQWISDVEQLRGHEVAGEVRLLDLCPHALDDCSRLLSSCLAAL